MDYVILHCNTCRSLIDLHSMYSSILHRSFISHSPQCPLLLLLPVTHAVAKRFGNKNGNQTQRAPNCVFFFLSQNLSVSPNSSFFSHIPTILVLSHRHAHKFLLLLFLLFCFSSFFGQLNSRACCSFFLRLNSNTIHRF